MKVAAVIPHWNRAPMLRNLLENLKQQTRPFDEVVVVDNGSTDGSAEVAEQAGARVVRLDRNYGFAVAVNRGIAATDADWVAILNNDVTLDPAWLQELLAVSMSDDEILGAGNDEFLTRAVSHAVSKPNVGEVVFFTGGNGVGKLRASIAAPFGDDLIVATFSNCEHARNCIERVLAAGKQVQVIYVYRPIVAAFESILDRAIKRDWTVAVDRLIESHQQTARTMAELYEAHSESPRIALRFVDNSGPLATIADVALTRRENYASKRDELYGILERRRSSLPAHLYEASAGSRLRSESERERSAGNRQPQQAEQGQAGSRPEVVSFATGKILSARDHTILDGTWDAISRAACPVRIGNGTPDCPPWDNSRPIHIASMTACLFRRRLFSEVGPLDERFESYLEDVDFGLRCAKGGFEGVYEPSATAYHQGSSTLGRWNPDTVRLLSRNQVLLAAKHFRGQPRWPILAGQLLWGLIALRHGCGLAWLRGKLAGFSSKVENDTKDAPAFTALLRESEADILAHYHELYWRLYSWLVR